MKMHRKLLFLLIVVVALLVIVVRIIPGIQSDPADAKKVICAANLRHVCIACLIYRDENNALPSQHVWCDILDGYYDNKEVLQCPSDRIGPCSYAMNENIPADANELPPDLVLLFESAPGWNQTGGPNDVVTDRHGRLGANIAFADGHVEFVKAEDIPKLRWEVGE